MKGLFKKDTLMVLKSWPIMVVILSVMLAIMVFMDVPTGILSFVSIYFMMQGVTSIITDRMCGWNLYQTTFPISRSMAIVEKYVFSLVVCAIGFVLGYALTMIFFPGIRQEDLLVSGLLGGILSLSALGAGIPLLILLPKNTFIVSIFGAFIPGALCIVYWSHVLSEMSAQVAASQGQIVFSMRTDVLWAELGVMALLSMISLVAAPYCLSKMDQR